MSTIELQQITKRFGNLTAVDKVDLDVGAGEVMCLLGPSGCGKTTSLRIVAGLESPTEGNVLIGGQRVNELSPSARDIAMVFQFYALYPSLSVRDNLAFPLRAERLPASEVATRVAEVADTLDLSDVLDRLPGHIAEGEKQRVAVGRAIVRDPSCFLFDEPLSRLDVELRQQMRGKIKEVLNGLSKATVIVTHDQLEALTMADRIAVMRDGIIEQIATPHEIFARPANVFVAGFIGTPQMNLLEADVIELDDQSARLAIDSQELVLPLPGPLHGVSLLSRITVGIRPRAFELVSEPLPTTLSAEVDLIEPMGSETLLHLVEGGRDIRIVVDGEIAPQAGTRLSFRPRANQFHLFSDDGRRLLS